MNLIVISHKECWIDNNSVSGYSTIGGFPIQMNAISKLFDQTTMILPVYKGERPTGAIPLKGKSLSVIPLPAPQGRDLKRKIALLFWLPKNFNTLWFAVKTADAIHAPVPGDLGTFGILFALVQKKRLFVRHCGTWGNRTSAADRFLSWLLPKISGGRNIIMATGGGHNSPCPEKPDIKWIFSTSISIKEWSKIEVSKPWCRGKTLRLVTASRLDSGKNTKAVIKALPFIKRKYPNVKLDVVGDGPCYKNLVKIANDLKVENIIKFHGRLEHEKLIKVVSNCNLFIFPTMVKEGFPKVVHEAFACGLPVVATSISVIPHLIGENERGIVLKDTKAKTVANAILSLVDNEDKLNSMSKSAREISREYTLENWENLIGHRLKERWGSLKHEKG